MSKSTVVLASSIMGALSVVVVVWWWSSSWDSSESGAFAGEKFCDFGEVRLSGAPAVREHTFTLQNVSGNAVEIAEVVESCGCTDVVLSTRELQRAGSLTVDVGMRFVDLGQRQVKVSLVLSDGTVETLWLRGTGTRMYSVFTADRHLRLDGAGAGEILLIANSLEVTHEPGVPTIDAPDGIRVGFAGWALVAPGDLKARVPARWHGVVEIEPEPDCDWDSEELGIEMPDGARLSVALTRESGR